MLDRLPHPAVSFSLLVAQRFYCLGNEVTQVPSSNLRRIMVFISDGLLEELDRLAQEGKHSRSQLVREAVRMYLNECRKRRLKDQLRRGYVEMGDLNRQMAEEDVRSGEQEMMEYEMRLAAIWPQDGSSSDGRG